ncbi:hypothetical protein OBBRIDRAFT_506153 [Obba rivulosa]|uniref:Uncharacterized protein n=1 Tax=Obba rivulosa TaxID=1052685 RepID=A0A8E2B0R3_9APHY|nr:hypothetical protein OBBRIDRAFT_506153 [Obba rivulosa]
MSEGVVRKKRLSSQTSFKLQAPNALCSAATSGLNVLSRALEIPSYPTLSIFYASSAYTSGVGGTKLTRQYRPLAPEHRSEQVPIHSSLDQALGYGSDTATLIQEFFIRGGCCVDAITIGMHPFEQEMDKFRESDDLPRVLHASGLKRVSNTLLEWLNAIVPPPQRDQMDNVVDMSRCRLLLDYPLGERSEIVFRAQLNK